MHECGIALSVEKTKSSSHLARLQFRRNVYMDGMLTGAMDRQQSLSIPFFYNDNAVASCGITCSLELLIVSPFEIYQRFFIASKPCHLVRYGCS
jgi:hypothetical protein